jgi:hypothetical protein
VAAATPAVVEAAAGAAATSNRDEEWASLR